MEILNRLKQLRNEDFIWIIYFFIATFALLSNVLERDFVLTKNSNSFKKSKTINVIIFFVAFFIYLYFVLLFTSNLNNMERNFNNAKYRNTFLQLIAAILFLVGGAIYLMQEILTNEVDEIGFG